MITAEELGFFGDKPEIVLGLVAAVGTPLDFVEGEISKLLTQKGYETETIVLSSLLTGTFAADTLKQPTESRSEYERITSLMNQANELRRITDNGVLALLAASQIHFHRPASDPRHLDGKAFVIKQLKHPDEVVWLRRIYGPAFHLISVYCPDTVREQSLQVLHNLTSEQARHLMMRDAGEEEKYGQQFTETFHRADFFVDLFGFEKEQTDHLCQQLSRYVDLVMGEGIITPTRDEYGMFMAYAASLRSADLSRQVGAAIISPSGDLVAVGANEVPAPGGGQYWGNGDDGRDFTRGADENTKMRWRMVTEVLGRLTPGWDEKGEEEKQKLINAGLSALRGSRLMSLTEFGRAMHAEMEAIIAANRQGKSVIGCTLYTTTFPCHNCAKHIVGAGISKVVYIEPYPKSMASDLHSDSIALVDERSAEISDKVRFQSFSGLAPRIYPILFSSVTPEGLRLQRKDLHGDVSEVPVGVRPKASLLSYVDRERMAASTIQLWIGTQEGDDHGED